MVKKIFLRFGSCVQLPTSIEVLPVTLTVYDDKGRKQELGSYLSPMPPNLKNSFHKWQKYVSPNPQDTSVRRAKFQPKQQTDNLENIDSNVNFEQIANDFITQLNQWLNERGWLNKDGNKDSKIKKTLEFYSSERDEIQIFIQTEDRELQGLPWQEWEAIRAFFTLHPNTEVSISATDFERPEQQQTLLLDGRVRILAIFGDERLGLDEEKSLITNLEKYGGIIEPLYQPKQETLEQALQNPKGWHIFFFAGHSGSDENGKIGWIEINPSEKIPIEKLTHLLEKLIRDKLHLAIFNSCDGLGLANQLTSLSLPYCVVMREPVESLFARRLLRHLLTAFVNGKSIFASMRTTRELLRQEFDEEGKHPGKSWLPVIVANPEARSLTWDGMFTERRMDRKWELIIFTILIIAFIGLPLSIYLEFGNFDTLTFYAKLYPHMIIYPSIFLGIAVYGLYRAICLIRQKTQRFWFLTALAFIFSCITVNLDMYASPLFLFDVKSNATAQVSLKVSQEQLQNEISLYLLTHPKINSGNNLILKKLDIEESIKNFISIKGIKKDKQNKTRQPYNIFLEEALQFKIWKSQLSFSHWFDAVIDFVMIFCAGELIALIIENLLFPISIFKKYKYISYLLICEIGILLWTPFYFYYIKIKELLLDRNTELDNLTALLYPLIFTVLIIKLIFTRTEIKVNKYRNIFSIITISIVLVSILIDFLSYNFIDKIFGINSINVVIPWVATILLSFIIFSTSVYLIDHKLTET